MRARTHARIVGDGDLKHYNQRLSLPIGKLNPNFIPDNNLLVQLSGEFVSSPNSLMCFELQPPQVRAFPRLYLTFIYRAR